MSGALACNRHEEAVQCLTRTNGLQALSGVRILTLSVRRRIRSSGHGNRSRLLQRLRHWPGGQEAWAAYQVATQGYSLTAAMGSGSVFSGVTYTGLAATGAVADRYIHGTDLSTAFNNRWSPMGLIGTMGIGAVGGAYQTAMFQAANVANTWKNFYTIEGAVIRGNQMLMTIPAKKAVQAAAQQTTPSQPPAQGRPK